METFKIGICEPLDFSEEAMEYLSRWGEVSLFNGDDIKNFIKDKDVIFIRLKYKITDELLEGCHRLRYICSPTTGLNHICITDKEISIISLRGESDFLSTIRATPEHILGLSIALLRNYICAFQSLDNLDWNRDKYRGTEIYGNKIGIIGMGRIGKILTSYYKCLGADVLYYDVDIVCNIEGAQKCVSIEELIKKTNVIILAANYTDDNIKMIGTQEFSLMKNKYFINAARGELIDGEALLIAVSENWFKGVAIDVLDNETESISYLKTLLKLSQGKNVIITPHIGGATRTSMARTELYIAEKLIHNMGWT